MLLNTSFNVRGEPMVCTVQDAYRCFMKSGIDVLVVENFLLLKSDQPEFDEFKIGDEAKTESFFQKALRGFSIITFPIRWLVSKLVLSVMFYVFITPIGLIWRNLNKDDSFQPIDLKKRSYWRVRSKPRDKSSYFKQY